MRVVDSASSCAQHGAVIEAVLEAVTEAVTEAFTEVALEMRRGVPGCS